MKKNYFWSLTVMTLVALMSVVFVSCVDDEEVAPILNVSPSSISLDGNGEDANFFDIESNVAWVIEVDKDWINLSTLSGSGNASVEITANENPDLEKRTANISITAGNITRRVRVTQEAGMSLNVSPSSLTLDGAAGKTATFTLNTTKSWVISGQPDWLQLSGLSGTGNTTISVTTLEENRSENPRTATLIITAGTKSATMQVIQSGLYPANTNIVIDEEYGLSNGYYFGFSFGSAVQGYTCTLYYASYFDSSMTEESAYADVINNDDIRNVNPIDGDYVYWYNLSPNTNYVLCAVAYSMKGSEKQWGKMTMKRVTSKSTATNFDVHIGTITYNSTKWNYTFNKDSRCHHFYSMVVTNNYAEILSSYPDIALAKFIKDLIKSSSTYDYILNDGSYYYERTSTDYALLVWAWGVSDTGNFSNNLSRQYKNLSSSSSECLANSQQLNGEPKKWKLPLEEWKEILKNVRVNYQ